MKELPHPEIATTNSDSVKIRKQTAVTLENVTTSY
jgi:hypothetical protein